MSLINRMLSDLESRRGGNLRNVDSVIDGLQPSEALLRAPAAKRRSPLVLAGAVAGACAMGVFLWQPWQMTPVAPTSSPMPATPVTPAALPSPAPQAATPPAPQPSAGSVPVVIADAPAASMAAPAVATAPDPVEQESPPEPARAMTADAAPEPEASREPESAPEPEAAPPPAVAERAREPRRSDAAPAPRRQHNEDSSFVIANASAPAETAELALALLDSGRPEEAEALLREGLAVQPDDSEAARVLGHLLLERGDARGALEVLSAAAPAITSDSDYHALMAAAEQRGAAHADAARRYRELLALQPANGQWRVGLGISLLATGDGRGAADAFRQALADPSLSPALRSFAIQQAGNGAGGSP